MMIMTMMVMMVVVMVMMMVMTMVVMVVMMLLGVTFDTGLYMHEAVNEVAAEAGWRLKSLLRTRKFHILAEMPRLYKAHILSFVESRTAGLHHAAPSSLQAIDRI